LNSAPLAHIDARLPLKFGARQDPSARLVSDPIDLNRIRL
jgi:hypothetical protein